jgi:hypothetical protein
VSAASGPRHQPVGCKRRNAALTSDAANVSDRPRELFDDLPSRSIAARPRWDRTDAR